MGNNFSLTRARIDFKSILFILATHPTFVAAWNDHYDKEDDAWVMKIFFPIIAALILLCLGSCGYANYCKKPSEHNEEDEVDRCEEVYSLSKPDRPYLTPHYQRRTFQPPPPAYDNHAFRPGQAPGGAPAALGGPKQITASSVYQRHNPTGQMGAGGQQFGAQGQGQFGQVNQTFTNSYSQFQPQFNQNQAIKPNPLRSYSFQVPQSNDIYGERSKSLWDEPNQFKQPKPTNQYQPNNGRSSPIQSTRSAPAGMNGLRRTFSSPNLTPSGSNGSFNPHGGNYSQNYNDYGQGGGLGQGGFNQGQNGQFNQRHSMNYGRSNPYQRTPSPASSGSTYMPAASEVGSTAPLFSRRRSPDDGNSMYGAQTQSGHGFGQPNAGRGYQDFNSNPRGGVRSYEMEDIYGRGGSGRPANNAGQYGGGQYNQFNQNQGGQFGQNFQNSQNFQNKQFQNNQFQQQNQNQFQNYNQQDFQNQPNNSIYEHLTPQYQQDPYSVGQQNMAYDPYDNNQNLPGY